MAFRKSPAACLTHLTKAITPIASLCILASTPSGAAEIRHQPLSNGREFIMIDGDIEPGDAIKFRTISKSYDKAAVFLSSNGGDVLTAIEIGKIIRIAGYSTFVPESRTCASSCALIWLAGAPRFLQEGGRVGFHAAYRSTNGQAQESGSGNALVGNYLTLLNLSQQAIYFATKAGPNQISWLKSANKTDADIDFLEIPSERTGVALTPPPIRTVAVKPTSNGTSTSPAFAQSPPPVAGASMENAAWTVFNIDADGTKSYYSSKSIIGDNNEYSIWVKFDYPLKSYYRKKYNLSFALIKYSFKCKTQESSFIIAMDYALDGSVVKTNFPSQRQYEPIAPGTLAMTLWNKTCGASQ